jgi:hypothetical protein
MANAPDSIIVTGAVFQQVPADQLLVTPTGGVQTTLANALAAGGGSGQWLAGLVTSLGTGFSIVSQALTYTLTQNWTAGNVTTLGTGLSISGTTLNSTGTTSLTLNNVTANATLGSLPASAYILYALIRETAGNYVSLNIGTTSGGSDVLGGAPINPSTANVLLNAQGTFSTSWFSVTNPQTLYLSSTSWNSASINITLVYLVGP